MLEHVPAAIHPRPFPVPHGEHAVVFRVRIQVDLLCAPDGRGREILVHARLKADVAFLEMCFRAPQGVVEATNGRAAVAGNKARGVESRGKIAGALEHGQAHQRLGTGHEDAPGVERVLVVQADLPNAIWSVHVCLHFTRPRANA